MSYIFNQSGSGGSSAIIIGTTVITGGTDTRVLFDDGGFVGEDAGFTYQKTTKTLTVAGNVTLAAGSITASLPNTITQTWNNGAVDFRGLQVNITNTASLGQSRAFEVIIGAISGFYVGAGGQLVGADSSWAVTGAGGTPAFAMGMWNAGAIGWTSAGAASISQTLDTYFTRAGAAGKVTLNGTTPMFQLGGTTSGSPSIKSSGAALVARLADDSAYAPFIGELVTIAGGTPTPAGGSTAARLLMGTTAGFGVYFGSGAPSVTAATGSMYLRSDGSTTTNRAYINTTGGTTWTAITTSG